MVVVEIDPGRPAADVRWEPNPEGELWPHVYGSIVPEEGAEKPPVGPTVDDKLPAQRMASQPFRRFSEPSEVVVGARVAERQEDGAFRLGADPQAREGSCGTAGRHRSRSRYGEPPCAVMISGSSCPIPSRRWWRGTGSGSGSLSMGILNPVLILVIQNAVQPRDPGRSDIVRAGVPPTRCEYRGSCVRGPVQRASRRDPRCQAPAGLAGVGPGRERADRELGGRRDDGATLARHHPLGGRTQLRPDVPVCDTCGRRGHHRRSDAEGLPLRDVLPYRQTAPAQSSGDARAEPTNPPPGESAPDQRTVE